MNVRDIVYGTPVMPIYAYPQVLSQHSAVSPLNARTFEVPLGIPFVPNG